jgi:GTP cyclohydrolase II
MSAPAAKAFSLPVMTMQPMASSASKAFSACAELIHQLVVQRIQLLGPVQRDHADLAGFGAHR